MHKPGTYFPWGGTHWREKESGLRRLYSDTTCIFCLHDKPENCWEATGIVLWFGLDVLKATVFFNWGRVILQFEWAKHAFCRACHLSVSPNSLDLYGSSHRKILKHVKIFYFCVLKGYKLERKYFIFYLLTYKLLQNCIKT